MGGFTVAQNHFLSSKISLARYLLTLLLDYPPPKSTLVHFMLCVQVTNSSFDHLLYLKVTDSPSHQPVTLPVHFCLTPLHRTFIDAAKSFTSCSSN